MSANKKFLMALEAIFKAAMEKEALSVALRTQELMAKASGVFVTDHHILKRPAHAWPCEDIDALVRIFSPQETSESHDQISTEPTHTTKNKKKECTTQSPLATPALIKTRTKIAKRCKEKSQSPS